MSDEDARNGGGARVFDGDGVCDDCESLAGEGPDVFGFLFAACVFVACADGGVGTEGAGYGSFGEDKLLGLLVIGQGGERGCMRLLGYLIY